MRNRCESWTGHEGVHAQFRLVAGDGKRLGTAAHFTDCAEPSKQVGASGRHPPGWEIGREVWVLLGDVLIPHELVPSGYFIARGIRGLRCHGNERNRYQDEDGRTEAHVQFLSI